MPPLCSIKVLDVFTDGMPHHHRIPCAFILEKGVLVQTSNSFSQEMPVEMHKPHANHPDSHPHSGAEFQRSIEAIVNGGNANGWMEWKNARGETLDDVYRKGSRS